MEILWFHSICEPNRVPRTTFDWITYRKYRKSTALFLCSNCTLCTYLQSHKIMYSYVIYGFNYSKRRCFKDIIMQILDFVRLKFAHCREIYFNSIVIVNWSSSPFFSFLHRHFRSIIWNKIELSKVIWYTYIKFWIFYLRYY